MSFRQTCVFFLRHASLSKCQSRLSCWQRCFSLKILPYLQKNYLDICKWKFCRGNGDFGMHSITPTMEIYDSLFSVVKTRQSDFHSSLWSWWLESSAKIRGSPRNNLFLWVPSRHQVWSNGISRGRVVKIRPREYKEK